MVDFAASWCIPCGELELTFSNDDVYELITKNFVPLKFDVSEDNDTSAERRGRYKAGTLPSVVHLSTDVRTVSRIDHMMEPDEMQSFLQPAILKLRSGSALAAGEPCK
jgi:thiol:disulfide interchange protein